VASEESRVLGGYELPKKEESGAEEGWTVAWGGLL